MAQKWALASIATATGASIWSYEKQNEIARFLWPQIPDTAVPYPGGILFPAFNATSTEPPRHNHTPWGVCMFPIAGVSSYYILKYTIGLLTLMHIKRKYRTGPTTPRWMGLSETFRVYSPNIVQHFLPLSISIPFATCAKVYRDGPGYDHDREFYRTGVEEKNWDFLKYSHPEPERPLLDSPIEILNIIQGPPPSHPRSQSPHPIGLEHPDAEALDDEEMLTWYYSQLGISVEKRRELPKKWLKLTKDYDPIADPEEPLFLPQALRRFDKKKKPKQIKYDPKAFAVDDKTPVGQLPNYGVADGPGIRLPWSTDKHGVKNTTSGALLTEEEFFDPQSYRDKELRMRAGLDEPGPGSGLDADGNPVDVATKYADLIKNNAATGKDLDVFALERRKAKEDMANPWQSYYYHSNSVVGRTIPDHARIAADNSGNAAWRLDLELEADKIKTHGRRKWYNADGALRHPRSASTTPVFEKPDNEISNKKWLESFQGAPMGIEGIQKMDHQAREKLVQSSQLDPHHKSPLPGYAVRRNEEEMQEHFIKRDTKYYHKNKMQNLPASWFPYEVQGLVKNRHDYYTGRGKFFADQPNLFTGEPAYDPNAVPSHPHGMYMSIQQAEDYYTEVERDDREYAKKVAGSFQKAYGVPFPKFEDPDLYDENTVKAFPHLERANKRLEMQTRYYNSLEDRVVNKPPLEAEPSLNERRLKQTTSQILRNDFNAELYQYSNQYRAAWQAKYPALKQLGPSSTADQIEYVLSFAAPDPNYDKNGLEIKRKADEMPALTPSYSTDRAVEETLGQDLSYRNDTARTLGFYETPDMKHKRELTPRDVLKHEEEYKKNLDKNQPLSQTKLDNEKRWY